MNGLFGLRGQAGPASAVIDFSSVEASARAGIANFGSPVMLGNTVLRCNPIDLTAQSYGGVSFGFEDLGGNACGCEALEECRLQTTELTPPAAIPSTLDNPQP